MASGKRVLLLIFCLAAIIAALITVAGARLADGPLHVGSTADEAWSFVRTNTSSPPLPGGLLKSSTSSAVAYAQKIEVQTRYYWRGNKFLVTRKQVFVLGTNRVVGSVRTAWSFK